VLVIPATWKADMGRVAVRGQPRQKVSNTPVSTIKLDTVVHIYIPSYIGSIGRRVMV
jgi:hypothetical protein